MTTVFIGGSRHIRVLPAAVRERLDMVMQNRLTVFIGDAVGVDSAVQGYLSQNGYQDVLVFCSDGRCRNNVGDWPLRAVRTQGHEKGADFHSVKDRAMASEATVGFMIWDGKSIGTLMNLYRLIAQQKKAVLYSATEQAFSDLLSFDDFDRLVTEHIESQDAHVARKFGARIALEKGPRQTQLI